MTNSVESGAFSGRNVLDPCLQFKPAAPLTQKKRSITVLPSRITLSRRETRAGLVIQNSLCWLENPNYHPFKICVLVSTFSPQMKLLVIKLCNGIVNITNSLFPRFARKNQNLWTVFQCESCGCFCTYITIKISLSLKSWSAQA